MFLTEGILFFLHGLLFLLPEIKPKLLWRPDLSKITWNGSKHQQISTHVLFVLVPQPRTPKNSCPNLLTLLLVPLRSDGSS